MKELTLPPELSCEIREIYDSMVSDYDEVAHGVTLSCDGCPDNCCDSYFLHYTYCEWAYLWQGLRGLGDEQLDRILHRARDYVAQSREMILRGERPTIMCPLNEAGRCALYAHRLMICRTHGVPATLTRPDGQSLRFPGCFRCQEIVGERYAVETEAPAMDRTILFQRLAQLESRFLGNRRDLHPKIKMTIAELIVNGPPRKTRAGLEQD
ncbi:MAG: hypothetical protein RBT36_08445 [Desulfobulbus sp.]|jgi:hypothetical protein|nr:hypothetical protein [Desulfobulbus sp.]